MPGPPPRPGFPAGGSRGQRLLGRSGHGHGRLGNAARRLGPDGGKGRGRGHRGPGAAEGDGLKSMMHVCDSGWSRGGNRDRGGKRGWAGISWPLTRGGGGSASSFSQQWGLNRPPGPSGPPAGSKSPSPPGGLGLTRPRCGSSEGAASAPPPPAKAAADQRRRLCPGEREAALARPAPLMLLAPRQLLPTSDLGFSLFCPDLLSSLFFWPPASPPPPQGAER